MHLFPQGNFHPQAPHHGEMVGVLVGPVFVKVIDVVIDIEGTGAAPHPREEIGPHALGGKAELQKELTRHVAEIIAVGEAVVVGGKPAAFKDQYQVEDFRENETRTDILFFIFISSFNHEKG